MLARCRPFGVSSSPHGYRARSSPPRAAASHCASVGSDLPTQAAYAQASYQETCVTGWFCATSDEGPPGRRQSAPRTGSHHGVPGTCASTTAARSAGWSSRWKTYAQPSRSAVVTYPVALTKVANFATVTATGSIQNGLSTTSRTGPSPSPALASGSSPPSTYVPPG